MPITITLQRAAEESGLSIRTLHYAIERGDLKSVTVGRRRLIPMRTFEAFLLRRQNGARPETRGVRSSLDKKVGDMQSPEGTRNGD
jgi:excisionase family DNA binding protein